MHTDMCLIIYPQIIHVQALSKRFGRGCNVLAVEILSVFVGLEPIDPVSSRA